MSDLETGNTIPPHCNKDNPFPDIGQSRQLIIRSGKCDFLSQKANAE